MPKFNQQKNALIAGELSPKLDGRTDLAQYQNGCKTLQNMIPLKQGGAIKRPGTVAMKRGMTEKLRLIPFVVSTTESYMVGIGNGSYTVLTPTQEYAVTVSSSGDYYTTDQLDDIQFVQSVDVLFLVHPDMKPMRIERVGTTFTLKGFDHNSNPVGILSHPFLPENTDTAKTLASNSTAAAGTTGITLTASGFTFDAGHVDSIFKITISGTTGAARITAVAVGGATATATVLVPFPATTASTDWEESAWSTYRGWPSAICFFESRLIYGGTNLNPDTFFGSATGNYYRLMSRRFAQDLAMTTNVPPGTGFNYYGPVADSDPISYLAASTKLNKIQWVASTKTLSIGTVGAEHVSAKDAAPITTTNQPTLNADTSHGSASIQPVQVSHCLVFVQRSGKKLMELDFDFYSESYTAEDLIFIADHLPGKHADESSRIKSIAYQEDLQLIWCIDEVGGLFCCLRDKVMQITAWCSQVIGGLNPYVHSIAIMPSVTGRADSLWLCVSREKADGSEEYFVEYMSAIYDSPEVTMPDVTLKSLETDYGPFYLDAAFDAYLASSVDKFRLEHSGNYSGITYTGPEYDISDYEGQEIGILADGFALDNVTIPADGVIPFGDTYDCAIVGFPYTSIVHPMRIEAGSAIGSAQGEIKRIDRVVTRFYRTNYAKIGPTLDQLEEIGFRESSVAMSDPTPLYTGDKSVEYRGDYETDCYIYIVSDKPLPFSVTSIAVKGVTYE